MRTRLLEFRARHPIQSSAGATYIAGGSGRQCLLLLHDSVGGHESWFELISLLEDSYRVIAPIRNASNALAWILEAEGIRRVHVFGHGHGALLARAFVCGHPEYAASMMLAGTPARPFVVKGPLRLPGFLGKYAARRWASKLLSAEAPELGDETRSFWAGHFAETGIQDPASHPALAPLEAWTGRILLFESDRDGFVPESEAAQVRRSYPAAIVHRFDGAGHFAHLSRADSYALRIHLFCGS